MLMRTNGTNLPRSYANGTTLAKSRFVCHSDEKVSEITIVSGEV